MFLGERAEESYGNREEEVERKGKCMQAHVCALVVSYLTFIYIIIHLELPKTVDVLR